MIKNEMGGKFFHITHSDDGKWIVKEVYISDPILHNSKEEALKTATKLAKQENEGPIHVVLHRDDGTFERVESFNSKKPSIELPKVVCH